MGYIKNEGIYKISNLVNGKVYIGSSNTVQRRESEHKSRLRGGFHENEHLQNAWNKYGEDNFEFSILEYCLEEHLLDREFYYMHQYNSLDRDKGYNIAPPDRFIHTEETKRKISKAHNGKKLSKETRQKLSNLNKGKEGRPHTEETKQKLSKLKKGIKFTEEHRQNLSKAHKGKKWSEAQRKGSLGKSKNISPESVREIRKLKSEGKTYKQLHAMFGISERSIFDIVKGKYHKDVL